MRKTIIAFLIAAGATPALAGQVEPGSGPEPVEAQQETPTLRERQEDTGSFVAERVRVERSQPRQAPEIHEVQMDRRGDSTGFERDEHRGLHREYRREHQELHRNNPTRREHRRFHREVQQDHRQEHREVHQDVHQDYRTEHRNLHRSSPSRREHRVFHREVNRDHQNFHRDWDPNWRRNDSYDWRGYRNRYGSLYRTPGYYDPFGSAYGYRRYSIGFSLGRPYFASRYVISDPWRYRLPPTSSSYRWIRYYNDVLLVDVFNGRVVDVIYDFFWQ